MTINFRRVSVKTELTQEQFELLHGEVACIRETTPTARVNFSDVVRFSSDRYSEWEHLADGVYQIAFDAEAVGAVRYWGSPIRDTLAIKGMLRRFEDVAKRYGDDIRQWYYALEALPLSSALLVERWIAGKWV